ncbi:MAG: protein kinase, partial [Myxococcota bacterium]|nr:protein kinase [Myxococcota bacterium]
MDSEPNQDQLIGVHLGDFVIEQRLGGGAQGAVYLATQRSLERQAVIKVLHGGAAVDERRAQRFNREALLASRIDHPYAAHIYAFDTKPFAWIAMEWVRGRSLEQVLAQDGPIPPRRLAPLLERIAEVVAYAHERGIVHRDLKPANIMIVERAGRWLPKLLDLGIAKLLSEVDSQSQVIPALQEATSAPRAAEQRSSAVRPATEEPPQAANAAVDSIASPSGSDPAPAANPSDWREDACPPLSCDGDDTVDGTFELSQVDLGNTQSERQPSPQTIAPGASLSASAASASVTQVGSVLGSPLYMAPEQWLDPSQLDGRADVYALGVIVYELLSGAAPYSGSLRELMMAHVQQAPPPLTGTLAPFWPALAKALAKEPKQRFSEPVAFASAFSLALEAPLRQRRAFPIDEGLRRELLSRAPTPIAECFEALCAAADTLSAAALMRQCCRLLPQTLSVLALACQGELATPPDEELVALLHQWRRRALDASDALRLCRCAVAPFAHRPSVYPMPVLVELLLDHDSNEQPAYQALQALQQAEPKLDRAASPEAVEAALDELAVILQEALRATLPLWALDWCALRAGQAERWMGLARYRQRFPIVFESDDKPRMALLDERRRLRVLLDPYVQCARPAPQLEPVLFLFDGAEEELPSLRQEPQGFRLNDEALWESFDSLLPEGAAELGELAVAARSPYPGLAPFSAELANLFFGREAERDIALNRLRLEPWLVIAGPSGAGKSSFALAGVMPKSGRQGVSFRPGERPLRSLCDALRQLEPPLEVDAALLRETPKLLGELLRDYHGQFLLCVDQFEECISRCDDAQEREAFAGALASMVALREPRLWLILTLRDDFLFRVGQLPGMRGALSGALMVLAPPGPKELERALVEPARRRGYRFDDPSLPGELVAELVSAQSAAFPLLAFVAARLWEERKRKRKRLTRAAYERMGGAAGALASHAESLYSSFDESGQRMFRRVFRRLLTAEGHRLSVSRPKLLAALGGDAAAQTVVEQLVEARLVLLSEEQGSERLELVHEALVQTWPRLQQWLLELGEGGRLRARLRAAALEWEKAERPKGLLWRADALSELELWVRRNPGELDGIEGHFAQACLQAHRQLLRWRRGAVATVVMLAVLLSAIFAILRERAELERSRAQEEQQRASMAEASARSQARLAKQQALRADEAAEKAERALTQNLIEQLRLAVLDGDAKKGQGLLTRLEALPSAFEQEAEASFLADRVREQAALLRWQRRFDAPLLTLTAQPTDDSYWIGALDGKLERLSAAGELLQSISCNASLRQVERSTSGQHILCWGQSRSIQVHRVDAEEPVLELPVDHYAVTEVVFLGESSLAVAGRRVGLRIHPLKAESFELVPAQFTVTRIAASEDGTLLAVGLDDGSLWLYRSDTWERIQELTLPMAIRSLRFDRAGQTLTVGAGGGALAVFDVAQGRMLASYPGLSAAVIGLSFSADERLLLAWDSAGAARVFHRPSGRALGASPSPIDPAVSPVFGPDAATVLSALGTAEVELWNARTGRRIQRFQGSGAALRALLSVPDGFLSADADGHLRCFEARHHALTYRHPQPVMLAAGSEEGLLLVEEGGALLRLDGRGELQRDYGLAPAERPQAIAMAGQDRLAYANPRGLTLQQGGKQLSDELQATGLVFSEKHLVAYNHAFFRQFALNTEELPKSVAFEANPSLVLASTGSERIAIGYGRRAPVIQVWDLQRQQSAGRLEGHRGGLTALAFLSPERLLSGAEDHDIIAWDLAEPSQLQRIQEHRGSIRALLPSGDHRSLLSISDDATAILWTLPESGRSTFELRLALRIEHGTPLSAAIWLGESRFALGDRDGRLVIYDVAGRLLERYDTHDGEIRALGLLSGGSVLWS